MHTFLSQWTCMCTCVEAKRTALGLITQSLPTFFIWVRNSHRPLGSLIRQVWLAGKPQGSTFANVLPSAGIINAPVFLKLSFALMWMLGMNSGFWPCKASGLKTEPSYRWVLAVIPEYLCFLSQLQMCGATWVCLSLNPELCELSLMLMLPPLGFTKTYLVGLFPWLQDISCSKLWGDVIDNNTFQISFFMWNTDQLSTDTQSKNKQLLGFFLHQSTWWG